MSDYTFYQLDEKLAVKVGLPAVAFPVRAEQKKNIFGKGAVNLNALFDECASFLADNPKYVKGYRDVIGLLAYQCGVAEGQKGNHEEASALFARGLDYVPDNLSLRTLYAHALVMEERLDEAEKEYTKVLRNEEMPITPLVWILAARVFATQDKFKKAYETLDACSFMVKKGDSSFWDFYNDMADKAGVKQTRKVEQVVENKSIEKTPPEKTTQKKFCGTCGKPLKLGAKFCGGCGKALL